MKADTKVFAKLTMKLISLNLYILVLPFLLSDTNTVINVKRYCTLVRISMN